MRGKKHVKAVLIYPKGRGRGLEESDFVWNGGNILPVEVDGTEADCHKIVREIFDDRQLVEKFHLTVANTANIGRLMPQLFFYPYAFTRLKKEVYSDIYYAMPCGNYSNLVAAVFGIAFAARHEGRALFDADLDVIQDFILLGFVDLRGAFAALYPEKSKEEINDRLDDIRSATRGTIDNGDSLETLKRLYKDEISQMEQERADIAKSGDSDASKVMPPYGN